MINAEVVLASVDVVLLLFGGGLLKSAFTTSNQMAVQKYESEQTKAKTKDNDLAIQGLKTEVALINKDIEGFSHHVKKLEMLPEISSKLTGLEALMGYIREQLKDFRSERLEHDKS